jgi:hypothetical protein
MTTTTARPARSGGVRRTGGRGIGLAVVASVLRGQKVTA